MDSFEKTVVTLIATLVIIFGLGLVYGVYFYERLYNTMQMTPCNKFVEQITLAFFS